MTDKNFHSDIKDSFEGQNLSAPDGLWDSISSASSLTADEFKVKESFNNLEKTAPINSWEQINRQLVIDDVWDRLSDTFDRRRFIWWWSRFAGILLLIGAGTTAAYYYSTEGDSEVGIVSPTEGNDEGLIAQETQSEDLQVEESSSENSERMDATVHESEELITEPTSTEPLNRNDEVAFTERQEIGESSINSPHEVQPIERINESGSDDNSNLNLFTITPAESLEIIPSEEQDEYFVDVTRNILLTNSPNVNRIPFNPFLPEPPVRIEDDNNGGGNKPTRYFDVGLVAYGNNTWIFNNDVKAGFNSNSLIQNKISMGYALGVQANYYITNASGISLEYDFMNAYHQNYLFYDEGRLVEKKIQSRYQKIALGYKHTFGQRRGRTPVFNVQLGPYFAFANQESTSVESTLQPRTLERIDLGARLRIGREHFIKKFTIEYGIASDIGFFNVATNYAKTPKKFNYTSTLSAGAFVSMRYNF